VPQFAGSVGRWDGGTVVDSDQKIGCSLKFGVIGASHERAIFFDMLRKFSGFRCPTRPLEVLSKGEFRRQCPMMIGSNMATASVKVLRAQLPSLV
jgi:hypothetical protein